MEIAKGLISPGATAGDLDLAWHERLSDANALLSTNRFASSIAAGLYALEIYLKVRICKRLDLAALPRACQFHELDGLLVLSGLSRKLNYPSKHPRLVKRNWDAILDLSRKLNDLRYTDGSRWSRRDAETFLEQLNDPQHGVLSWLQRQK